MQNGYRVVVDVDLEKFLDRVNHHALMERLARRIDDKAVLRLIRRYLVAEIKDGGVVVERQEGAPQGEPLSPLLASALLDEVDRALERDGVTASCFSCQMRPTTTMSMCAAIRRANGCWKGCVGNVVRFRNAADPLGKP